MSSLSIVLPVVLLVVAVVSEAGARGWVPRNGFLGIRIPSTLRTDEGWVAGHRAAAPISWIGFAVVTDLGAAIWFVPSLWIPPLVTVLVIMCVAMFIAVIVAAGKAARAADITVSR